MVRPQHLAVHTQRGGVEQAALLVDIHEPEGSGTRSAGGHDPVDGGQVVGDEPRSAQEILGGVPGDGQFGEDGQVTAGPRCVLERADDQFSVSVEVADDRVELAGHQPQSGHVPQLTGGFGGPRYSVGPDQSTRL